MRRRRPDDAGAISACRSSCEPITAAANGPYVRETPEQINIVAVNLPYSSYTLTTKCDDLGRGFAVS